MKVYRKGKLAGLTPEEAKQYRKSFRDKLKKLYVDGDLEQDESKDVRYKTLMETMMRIK